MSNLKIQPLVSWLYRGCLLGVSWTVSRGASCPPELYIEGCYPPGRHILQEIKHGWDICLILSLKMDRSSVGHKFISSLRETAVTESRRQRAVRWMDLHTGVLECTALCRLLWEPANSLCVFVCVCHYTIKSDKQMLHSLAGSFVLWTVTLGIPGPGDF